MSYTPEQQGRIDASNAKVATAQKNRDSAIADYKSRIDNLCNQGWWNYLSDCDINDGISQWKNKKKFIVNTAIASTGAVFVFGSAIGAKKWGKPSSCEDALEKGPLISYKCRRGKGDCIKSDTCDSKVAEYNAKLNSVNSSASQVEIAEQALLNAQADLKQLLDTIAGEVKNDPTFLNTQSSIAAGIQKNKQILLFAGVVVAILVLGAVLWKRSA